MLPRRFILLLTGCLTAVALLYSCREEKAQPDGSTGRIDSVRVDSTVALENDRLSCFDSIEVPFEVRVGRWYKFIDSLAARYDSLLAFDLRTEHILHANMWLLDTLVSSDYDIQMSRDSFLRDNRLWIVLRKGQKLCIPDSAGKAKLQAKLDSTWLDINIPEFRMRIVQGSDTLFAFKVRVGQVRVRHLDLAGGYVDLRTRPGEGKIIRVNTDPLFLNPVTGKKFTTTGRDDGKRTEMPLIPWIEPEINKTRYGQLIHPTTNPVTLGKTYSNGCIGISEANAWRVYFYAPVGTRVKIRYDLEVVMPAGDTLHLKDVYNMNGRITLPPLHAPKPKVDTAKKDTPVVR